MAKPPLSRDLQERLRKPNPCVMATRAPSGELHTAATWYEWRDDGKVLLNMDRSRQRFEHIRHDPRVALTIFDTESWYNHISIVGRVSEIYHDSNLHDIDRLSQHYRLAAFPDRSRDSWSALIDVLSWHGWHMGRSRTAV